MRTMCSLPRFISVRSARKTDLERAHFPAALCATKNASLPLPETMQMLKNAFEWHYCEILTIEYLSVGMKVNIWMYDICFLDGLMW